MQHPHPYPAWNTSPLWLDKTNSLADTSSGKLSCLGFPGLGSDHLGGLGVLLLVCSHAHLGALQGRGTRTDKPATLGPRADVMIGLLIE